MEEYVMPENNKRKSGSGFGKVLLLVVAVVALIVLANSLVVTAENKYTLVKQFGKIERIIDKAGLSFKVPFIQSTDTLPKQILIYDLAASEVITMDKKTMVADSYVLWRINAYTLEVGDTVQRAQQFADAYRIAGSGNVTTIR